MVQQPNKDRTTMPPPPKPPLDRVMREGVMHICINCGSTMSNSKWFIIGYGERLCDNNKCPNSKSRFKKR